MKTSLTDYPGHPASVVFTAGCPLVCPYCHNSSLISGEHPADFLPRRDVIDLLSRRGHLIDHVVVTGGEPLFHHDLPRLFDELADIGMVIKLDTCGMYPSRLKDLLNHPALSFVAMDIKTAPSHYTRVGGGSRSPALLEGSLHLLRNWAEPESRDYELRTVMAPEVVSVEDVGVIESMLLPGEIWRQNPLKQYH